MVEGTRSIPSEVTELFKSFTSIPHSELQVILSQSHHGQGLISLLLSTLQSLASTSIKHPSLPTDSTSRSAIKSILNLVDHLLELKAEGTQGLVRQLEKESTCLNLCLAAESSFPKSVRRVIKKLVDSDKASHLLVSVEDNLKQRMVDLNNSSNNSITSVLTSVTIISRLSPIIELINPDSEEVFSLVSTMTECYNETLPTFADRQGWQSFNHQSLLGNSHSSTWVINWLEIKFQILRSFQSLFQLFKSKASPSSFSKLLNLSSSSSITTSIPPQIKAPLVSLSLVSDLNLIDPSILKHTFSDPSSTAIISKAKEEAHSALVASGSPPNGLAFATPRFSGPAWELLKREARAHHPRSAPSSADKGKGKARALDDEFEPQVDPDLLDLVSSILPHLSSGPSGELGLKKRLASKRYAGKSSEEVLQILRDEEENGIKEEDILIPEINNLEIRSPTPPPFNPKKTAASSRANVFDQQPIDMSKVRWRGGNALDEERESSMSNDLKAQILARVEAQEKEQLEEEWNLEEESGLSLNRGGFGEVGFEEELENDEPTGIHRRQGIPILGGANGQARDWNRRLEDLSDNDEEENDQDQDLSAMEGKGQPVKSTSHDLRDSTSNVERERNDERILVKAWSSLGENLFGKDARKSKDRKNLLIELGNGWDDHRVESWATMFKRNPRKDKLLSSATDLLTPNLNRAPAPTQPSSSDDQASRFGPDRGRGGRLPRGGGRGGSDSQSSSRGGGEGATRGRGAHSGNDRGARQKEKRGNAARQRGFDRKAARGAAGAGGL